MSYKLSKLEKNLLIEWLCEEGYSLRSTQRQLKEATFTKENNIITIKYANGIIDVVKLGIIQLR